MSNTSVTEMVYINLRCISVIIVHYPMYHVDPASFRYHMTVSSTIYILYILPSHCCEVAFHCCFADFYCTTGEGDRLTQKFGCIVKMYSRRQLIFFLVIYIYIYVDHQLIKFDLCCSLRHPMPS